MTSNNQTTKGPNINSKQKLPKLNKFAKAQKWFSRLNFAYELSKSIRNDFRNYKEINEEILRIEETINELENIDDNENDDEQQKNLIRMKLKSKSSTNIDDDNNYDNLDDQVVLIY